MASLKLNNYVKNQTKKTWKYKGSQNYITNSITRFYKILTNLIHTNDHISNQGLLYTFSSPWTLFFPDRYRATSNLKERKNKESNLIKLEEAIQNKTYHDKSSQDLKATSVLDLWAH